jgi:hypothetical protein
MEKTLSVGGRGRCNVGFLSIGLAELIILVGVAGLAMLVVAAIAAAVVSTRRADGARLLKWIAIVGLVLLVLALVGVGLGLALIAPVRVERSAIPTYQPVVVKVEGMAAEDLTPTLSAATPVSTPPARTAPPNPSPVRDTQAAPLAIVPDTWLEALAIPPMVAALIVFIAGAVVAGVFSRWPAAEADDSGAPSRYALPTLAFWVALSLFLILDLGLGLAVSLYPRFVAAYAALWVLVGALLLYRRPLREKVLILALFAAILFSVRFIDWNSRKPFLRRFTRIKEGMTASQVDQIMGEYGNGYYGGPPPSLPEDEPRFDEQGRIIEGSVTYRHTDEPWGNSDWGVVTFEERRVVRTQFLHD